MPVLSDEVVSAIASRNARFRAWAALGVPVKGVWWFEDPEVRLEIGCAQCGAWCPSDKWWWLYGMDGEALKHEEEDTLQALADECPHLAPLLGPEPEDFAEVLALEILAGDPPR